MVTLGIEFHLPVHHVCTACWKTILCLKINSVMETTKMRNVSLELSTLAWFTCSLVTRNRSKWIILYISTITDLKVIGRKAQQDLLRSSKTNTSNLIKTWKNIIFINTINLIHASVYKTNETTGIQNTFPYRLIR